MTTQEREDMFRYLDAKFEGINTRIDGFKALWEAEAITCDMDRKDLFVRMKKLEIWRATIVGSLSVLVFILSGIPGWFYRLIQVPGAK